VDRDLFDRVQRLIKLKKRPDSKGNLNIFLGIMKCADCDGNMTYHAYNGKSGSKGGQFLCNRYRRANGADVQRKTCTAHYTPYNDIYAATLNRLNALIAANLSEEEVLRRLTSDQEKTKPNMRFAEKLKRRQRELENIIRKIVEQNALGVITDESFATLYNGYISEQQENKAKLAAIEAEQDEKNNLRENVRLFIEQIRKYSPAEELTREMLLDLMDRIEIHEPTGDKRAGTRQQEMEFFYRFIGKLPEVK